MIMLSLEEAYMRIESDCDDAFKTVMNQLFSILLDWHLGPLNRRNHKNRHAFDAGLRKFLASSSQEDKLYGRLKRELKLPEKEILVDLKGLKFADFDSTSTACTGTIFRILARYLEEF